MPQISEPHVNATSDGIDAGQAKGIDKSILTVGAPRRYRNREHLRSVAQQACILCGRKPSDPHPVPSAARSATSSRCHSAAGHHRAVHRSRDERAWWRQAGIDPIKHKYRRLLGEVLVASFFLQLFALVSPLFFQVVIDKVLVA
jgi:hypothetical protein